MFSVPSRINLEPVPDPRSSFPGTGSTARSNPFRFLPVPVPLEQAPFPFQDSPFPFPFRSCPFPLRAPPFQKPGHSAGWNTHKPEHVQVKRRIRRGRPQPESEFQRIGGGSAGDRRGIGGG